MALSREFEGSELAEARARFFREAETAGRLQHPDIVTIFDAGEDDGLAYIAMEFARAATTCTRHTLPGRLLPVPQVLRIAGARGAGAGPCARQGVVHRDIKPANVMIDLATDTVKVTDFGIARITDACRTRTGMVLGTPVVHVARADGRAARRRPQRPLLARRDAVPAAHRRAAAPRRVDGAR